jgi:hypothetical protein
MSRYVLESAKESATLKPATRKILRLQELTSSELLSHGWVKRWRCVQLEALPNIVSGDSEPQLPARRLALANLPLPLPPLLRVQHKQHHAGGR